MSNSLKRIMSPNSILNLSLGPSSLKTHGHSTKNSREYRTWLSMIQRCHNANDPRYASYGGAGISVAPQWRKFEVFYRDIGPRPEGKTLDRFPNKDGNYEPGNCRWATPTEQQNNMRNNRIVVAFGEAMTVAEWSRTLGINKHTISKRLQRGWSDEDSLSRAAPARLK